jgi:hypothetical protein
MERCTFYNQIFEVAIYRDGPGLNTPHARTMVKTLKLAIYLFLEF